MGKILVGSRAFFDGMEGFNSKDADWLVLTDEAEGFEWRMEQSLRGECTFVYKTQTAQEMVQRTLDSGDALLVGKFLVPEVAEAIGASVEDILPLEALLPSLDDKHRYVATIFEAVKKNGTFNLTPEQLAEAYVVYKEARERGPEAHPRPATQDDAEDDAEAETEAYVRPDIRAIAQAAREAAQARRVELRSKK